MCWYVFWVCSECVMSVFRVCSECVQSVFRVRSGCVQSVFRVCSECVQSVFNIEVISSPSASSVSIFGIFHFSDICQGIIFVLLLRSLPLRPLCSCVQGESRRCNYPINFQFYNWWTRNNGQRGSFSTKGDLPVCSCKASRLHLLCHDGGVGHDEHVVPLLLRGAPLHHTAG